METADILFSAVINILSIYINFRAIKIFLVKKENFLILPNVIYFFVWFTNWLVYFTFRNFIFTIASLFAGLIIAVFLLYEGGHVQKVLAVSSSVAVGVIIEDIVWYVLGNMKIINDEAIGSLSSSIIYMLIVMAVEKFLKFDKQDKISKGNNLNIIIILAGNLVVGEILIELGVGRHNLAMIGMSIICVVDVSTYYLYNKITEAYRKKIEQNAVEQKALMYENQFELMRQSQSAISALQHDMKNHILLLESYLKDKEYDNALRYIEEINSHMKISGQYVNTGNKEIDAILNYILEKAEEISCRVETKIEVPDSHFISQFDLNVLLSNLLDNALEALEKTGKRYLYICLKYQKGIFVVKIYNSFDGTVLKSGIRYMTRKSDKKKHGLGLKNIDEIIEKYNGEKEIEISDNLFKTNIMLYTKL